MKNLAMITLFGNGIKETTELVEINEDLTYRDMIINELSLMALEVCPLLVYDKKYENTPIIDLPRSFFEHSEYDDINEVIEGKIEEFEALITPLILKHFNITLKDGEWLYFMESYRMSKEEIANGITMHYTIEITK